MVTAAFQKEGALFGRDRATSPKHRATTCRHQRHHLGQHLPGEHRPGRRLGSAPTNPTAPACPGPTRSTTRRFTTTAAATTRRRCVTPGARHRARPASSPRASSRSRPTSRPSSRRRTTEQDPHRHPAGAALGPVQHPAQQRALQHGAVQQHGRQRLRLDHPASRRAPSTRPPSRTARRRRRPTCWCAIARRRPATATSPTSPRRRALVAGVKGVARAGTSTPRALYSQSKVRRAGQRRLPASYADPAAPQQRPRQLLRTRTHRRSGAAPRTNFTGDAFAIKTRLSPASPRRPRAR